MLDLSGLNPQQYDAVTHYEGPTLILAGAGTGKTRVITMRMAYMLQMGIAPGRIAAMTFTNKAAKEMRERVGALVGLKVAHKLNIGTFHSFCLEVLRNYPTYVDTPDKFTLIGTSDQLDLVKKALDEKNWSGLYKADFLHSQIGMCKNWLLRPEDIIEAKKLPSGIGDPYVLAEVYYLYERQLKLNRAIDFDDCILKVILGLRESPRLKELLLKRFHYFLVDEFQDTNMAQFAILEELASARNHVCAVGDDDQSIYSWRGAMYETLSKYQEIFKDTRLIKLEQNYRCTSVILDAANTVIANNQKRMEKTLWSDSKTHFPIELSNLEDAQAEARHIATKIVSNISNDYDPQDIAILYRTNSQAKLIEMALRECNLPYKTFGGQSFFARKEVKDFLSYLRIVGFPDDHLALWRIINVPPRGIGLKTQEIVEQKALELNQAPFRILASEPPDTQLAKKTSSFVQSVRALASLPLNTPEDFIHLGDEIIRTFKLVDYIKSTSKNVMARQNRIENLRSLPKWLGKASEDSLKEYGKIDSRKVLDSLTLEAPPREEDGEKPHYISLMSIHASKGLEFPIVFLAGLEDGLLPHKNSIGRVEDIAEERRLLYVALTRAKQKLYLSYALARQTGFQKEIQVPSRFLKELPEDIQNAPNTAQSEEDRLKAKEEKKQKTINRLRSLRDSLNI